MTIQEYKNYIQLFAFRGADGGFTGEFTFDADKAHQARTETPKRRYAVFTLESADLPEFAQTAFAELIAKLEIREIYPGYITISHDGRRVLIDLKSFATPHFRGNFENDADAAEFAQKFETAEL